MRKLQPVHWCYLSREWNAPSSHEEDFFYTSSLKEDAFCTANNRQDIIYSGALNSATTLHDIYNVTDSNGLAGKKNKGIYKYMQTYIQDIEKKETAVPKNGGLATEVSTQLSIWIKTSTIDE
jgi:hypothetical protein